MKILKLTIVGLLMISTLFSCKNNGKDGNDLMKAVKGINALKEVGENSDKYSKRFEELKTLTPLKETEIEKIFKDNIDGFNKEKTSKKRKLVNVTEIKSTYQKGENSIDISILDSAGQYGALIYYQQKLARSFASMAKDEKNEYESGTFSGIQANIITTKNIKPTITRYAFFVKERYLIVLSSANVSKDKMEDFFKSLDISSLQ